MGAEKRESLNFGRVTIPQSSDVAPNDPYQIPGSGADRPPAARQARLCAPTRRPARRAPRGRARPRPASPPRRRVISRLGRLSELLFQAYGYFGDRISPPSPSKHVPVSHVTRHIAASILSPYRGAPPLSGSSVDRSCTEISDRPKRQQPLQPPWPTAQRASTMVWRV